MHAEVRPPKDYDAFASLYDLVAHVGSFGKIRASKACQTARLRPGDRVLFAGSGTGEDAVAAARRGCHVTCVDASARMLARARARARRAGTWLACVHGDIRSHAPAAPFDAVCANHLLNVFAEREARDLLARLAGFVRPGGIVMVADFAPPRGLRDAMLHAHWWATVTIGVLFRLCDLHRLYDYTTWLDDAGLALVEQRRFAVLGVLPAYRNLVLQRPFDAAAENR
jgi:demethylmenaquinone methyltransferase/2-methoxy-6-polyprenyl-1,4-benzoquinol methylase